MMTTQERFDTYVNGRPGARKIFACVYKAGSMTVFGFFTPDGMRAAQTEPTCIREKADGFRWLAPMINKPDNHYEFMKLIIRKPWKAFEANKQGLLSTSQELAAIEALNLGGEWVVSNDEEAQALANKVRALVWEHTGNNHRRGISDGHAVALDGTEWDLEVKGVNSRLYHS